MNRGTLPLSCIQSGGESLYEGPLLSGSERDLGSSADSKRDIRSSGLGEGPDNLRCQREISRRVWTQEKTRGLSSWTCNGPTGMSSLLFA